MPHLYPPLLRSAGGAVVLVFLPETKGVSLEAIQRRLGIE